MKLLIIFNIFIKYIIYDLINKLVNYIKYDY